MAATCERENVDNIDWKSLLFEFDGRINRAKFWGGSIAVWAAVVLMFMIAGAINSSAVWFLFVVAYIPVVWAGLALSIKRWHDRGKSGWWILIAFVPFIGGIWALVETGFLPGTPDENQYGPNPLEA